MLAEKFLLLLETLISRVVDEKPPAVTSTRATFPDPRHSVSSRLQRLRVGRASRARHFAPGVLQSFPRTTPLGTIRIVPLS